MAKRVQQVDVLVVGAGPAGMAAACCASQPGQQVALIDDNPAPGGQIWRGRTRRSSNRQAADWLGRLHRSEVSVLAGARAIGRVGPNRLAAETEESSFQVEFQKLILATGARERFIPFPGWTLPNVAGAGGLQALVKSGLPIRGKRVVVAGSGPLLLAVAAFLVDKGAQVQTVAEQAPMSRLLLFAGRLAGQPSKIWQSVVLKARLMGVRYRTSCWPVKANGQEKLTSVELQQGRRRWEIPCDYLACGFGLAPNLELPAHLGCEQSQGFVKVDELQQTSVDGVYCAGEPTGIGGLDLALVEGRIAGLAAAGRPDEARRLFAQRRGWQRFARSLERAFALRPELKQLPQPSTLVCRCEDVAMERLQNCSGWREAKLQTRCGMGSCQGRVCGNATEFLLGWIPHSVRPPVFPARLETLAGSHRGTEGTERDGGDI
ncbi:MAG: FAD/NAD(P)-binding oxidoreductase [Acidobacteriota bacterium]